METGTIVLWFLVITFIALPGISTFIESKLEEKEIEKNGRKKILD